MSKNCRNEISESKGHYTIFGMNSPAGASQTSLQTVFLPRAGLCKKSRRGSRSQRGKPVVWDHHQIHIRGINKQNTESARVCDSPFSIRRTYIWHSCLTPGFYGFYLTGLVARPVLRKSYQDRDGKRTKRRSLRCTGTNRPDLSGKLATNAKRIQDKWAKACGFFHYFSSRL